jgi:hypothetical protein
MLISSISRSYDSALNIPAVLAKSENVPKFDLVKKQVGEVTTS